MEQIYLILILVVVVFVSLAAILKRYKRCPSDKILVIYGKIHFLRPLCPWRRRLHLAGVPGLCLP